MIRDLEVDEERKRKYEKREKKEKRKGREGGRRRALQERETERERSIT